jgi:hypothetical protein
MTHSMPPKQEHQQLVNRLSLPDNAEYVFYEEGEAYHFILYTNLQEKNICRLLLAVERY